MAPHADLTANAPAAGDHDGWRPGAQGGGVVHAHDPLGRRRADSGEAMAWPVPPPPGDRR
jgi:hypothetical protein